MHMADCKVQSVFWFQLVQPLVWHQRALILVATSQHSQTKKRRIVSDRLQTSNLKNYTKLERFRMKARYWLRC